MNILSLFVCRWATSDEKSNAVRVTIERSIALLISKLVSYCTQCTLLVTQ